MFETNAESHCQVVSSSPSHGRVLNGGGGNDLLFVLRKFSLIKKTLQTLSPNISLIEIEMWQTNKNKKTQTLVASKRSGWIGFLVTTCDKCKASNILFLCNYTWVRKSTVQATYLLSSSKCLIQRAQLLTQNVWKSEDVCWILDFSGRSTSFQGSVWITSSDDSPPSWSEWGPVESIIQT